MKRKLLVLALGITFLILMTFLATIADTIIPRRPSPQVQTVQTSSYQVTLQVDPNPPLITQPATLSLRIMHRNSQQLVTTAHVLIETSMETMDMGTDRATAQPQTIGGEVGYQAHAQFTMSGPWQVRVQVAEPGSPTEIATFEITAQ